MAEQLPSIVPKIAERLGDNRDDIRASARKALLSSLDSLGAGQFFQLLLPSFSSRKPKVKEGVRTAERHALHSVSLCERVNSQIQALDCYLIALQNVPIDDIPLSTLVPAIMLLLDDRMKRNKIFALCDE
jgi:hypothetical protein